MSDQNSRLDRRSVLKNVGLAAGAVLGVAGTASADDDVGTEIICGYDCYNTGSICQVGPVYTYEVVKCCKHSDGTTDCESWYQCGCHSECSC